MTERGFHPFAVLHFLRKTILLYLLPLLQVLFARNWAALRTALVQGAALLTVLAAVSAAVLHAGRWRVDAQGTLRVRWRLGVRLDRCLKASQLAALTIERPLLYRLAGASRVVLYPAGQKRTLTLLLSAQNAQFLADRMMPRRDAVAHTPRGGEKLAFAVLGANGLSTLALLALAIKQSRPYAPDAQTAAFAHLNRIAAWAARWLPMGTAWLLVLGGVLFCASLVRSAAHAAHYTVWRTESHLGSRGGFVHRYEMRLALEHLSYADLRRSPATWALGCCPVFVTAGSCQPEIPFLVWREDGPFLQELLPGFVLPPKAPLDTAGRSIPAFFFACRHPLRAVPAADSGIPLHPARPHGAASGGHCCVCRPAGGCVQRLAQRGHLAAKRPPDPALAARLPSARHLRALPCSGPDGHAVAMGRGGGAHQSHPHLSGRGEVQGAQRKVQRIAFFAFLKL